MNRLLLPVLVFALLAPIGCRQAEDTPAEPPTLETEEVAAPEAFDPDQDPRAAPRSANAELRGVLPSDFPRDLPLSLPASIVDFSPTDSVAGERSVTFNAIRASIGSVRNELVGRLGAAGWQLSEEGADRWRLSRDGRTAWLTLRKDGPMAQYQYRY